MDAVARRRTRKTNARCTIHENACEDIWGKLLPPAARAKYVRALCHFLCVIADFLFLFASVFFANRSSEALIFTESHYLSFVAAGRVVFC